MMEEGATFYNVLYIDDEREHTAKLQEFFTPEAIDRFAHEHAGLLSESAVDILKHVHLITVHNDAGVSQLLAQKSHPQARRDTPVYKAYEAKMTPASRVSRDIYDGVYDLVITDLNMPASDKKTNDTLAGAGGYQIANVAKLANVPVIFNTTMGHDDLADNLMFMSPFTMLTGAEPSANHVRFSNEIAVARKDNQYQLYLAVADKIEHLHIQPHHYCLGV